MRPTGSGVSVWRAVSMFRDHCIRAGVPHFDPPNRSEPGVILGLVKATYVAVLLVQAVVLIAIWLFSRHFAL